MNNKCKNCGKEKPEHHIHPFNGTYHCVFGNDSKMFVSQDKDTKSGDSKQ